MRKVSGKDFVFALAKAAMFAPFIAIKDSSIKLYNNIKTNSDKIKPKILFEKNVENINKILLLNDGNFLLLFFNYYYLSNLEIINGQTYQRIKLIKCDEDFYFPDVILTSKNRNEILLIDSVFKIKYIEFDDNYNIKNSFFKIYEKKDRILNFSCLTLLKNEKIVYKGYKSCYKEEEDINFGLAKIYILKLDRINKDIIMEFKINAFTCCFYEIKSKNEYLVNLKKDYISVINSNNYRTKKSFKFCIDETMKLLNDKFFIQAGGNNELNLYSLDNFQLVKTFLTSDRNKISNIYIFDNCFLTYEIFELEYSENTYYIKKWKFDEEKNEIISLGHFKLDKEINFGSIIKIKGKGKEDLFLIGIIDGYKFIEMPNKNNK